MLRLETLGGLGLKSELGHARGAGAQRRPLALLALLAASGGISRDRILAFLWPESDESSARNALKQIVYSLRRDLDCPELVVGSVELRLNPDVCVVDLWEFKAAFRCEEFTAAVDLYSGPFLDGVYVSGAAEFDRWVEETRAALAYDFTTAAERVVATAMNSGAPSQAVALLRRVSALEPLNSRWAVSLIEALAAGGDRAGALQHAKAYRALLRTELDVDTEPAFDDLVNSLRFPQPERIPFSGLTQRLTEVTQSASSFEPDASGHAGHENGFSSAAPSLGDKDIPQMRGRQRFVAVAIFLLAAIVTAASAGAWFGPARARFEYRLGRASLSEWEVQSARAHFKAAVRADSALASAYLALAEVASWAPTDPTAHDEQRWAANLALHHAPKLTTTERLHAAALAAAADLHWDEACRQFTALIGRDSTSYAAWFGRAECLARDTTVVPDASSPSGWRFRTSYQAAISAYLRAFDLRPDFHRAFAGNAIGHLSRVLFLQPNRARRGVVDGQPPLQLAAFPGWEGDTLAFVPYPLADIQKRRRGSTPETTLEAIAHNKETLRRLTALWVASSPRSADAYEAQASVLEQLGELDVAREGTTAVGALEVARRLSRVPEQQLRLAVVDVRFRVKQSRFRDARTLVDSLLHAWPDPTSVVAQWLSPMAALVGDAPTAARLQRIAAPLAPPPFHGRGWSDPPVPVTAAWLSLMTYASAGGPPDSIGIAYARLESLLQLVEPAARPVVRSAMMQEVARFLPNWLADSVRASVDTLGDPIIQMQTEVHRGDTAAAKKRFAALEAARAHFRLADRWPDAVLLESKILLSVHDTSTAIAMIDPYLSALPVLHSSALDRVQTAVSIPRLMTLRATLASAQHDTATQHRWESATAALSGPRLHH